MSYKIVVCESRYVPPPQSYGLSDNWEIFEGEFDEHEYVHKISGNKAAVLARPLIAFGIPGMRRRSVALVPDNNGTFSVDDPAQVWLELNKLVTRLVEFQSYLSVDRGRGSNWRVRIYDAETVEILPSGIAFPNEDPVIEFEFDPRSNWKRTVMAKLLDLGLEG